MVLGLEFSWALYFVMAVLQFIAVCLVVILWTSFLVFLPMSVRSSIQCLCFVGFVAREDVNVVNYLQGSNVWVVVEVCMGVMACNSNCFTDSMVYL